MIAKVLQIKVTSIESTFIQINLKHFSINCLLIYDQIDQNKWLFLGVSLLEFDLHTILPIVNHNFLWILSLELWSLGFKSWLRMFSGHCFSKISLLLWTHKISWNTLCLFLVFNRCLLFNIRFIDYFWFALRGYFMFIRCLLNFSSSCNHIGNGLAELSSAPPRLKKFNCFFGFYLLFNLDI